MNANFSTKSLFFISVTGLLLFSITTSHPQVGLSQKNESKLTSSDDMPAVTMDSCRDAVGKPLSKPIALLFVAACLAFAPTVFKMEGDTLGLVDKSGGIDPFQAKPDAAEDESSAGNQDDSTTNGDDVSGDSQAMAQHLITTTLLETRQTITRMTTLPVSISCKIEVKRLR